MSSFNQVVLVGNLARDPEVRATGGGKVCNLTVVTSERYKDRDGNRQEKAEFHRVTIWNERLVDIAERYLTKGARCLVVGQLQTRKWTDQSGQERLTTEVVLSKFRGELVLLGGRGEDGGRDSGGDYAAGQGKRSAEGAGRRPPADFDLDETIPFTWIGVLIAPALALLTAVGVA